jgi:glycosyltransferase involved in cell wall biosynthesis
VSDEEVDAGGRHERPRGRLVMLVDNKVEGDSRVQKAAHSAGEAGWDVTVLGKSPDGRPRSWPIGRATVRLVPVAPVLDRRRHEFRRRWLLAPFAYPPTGIADNRAAAMRAWQHDLRARRAQTGRAHRGESFAAGLTERWVALRALGLRGGRKLRRPLSLPGDRAYTWFWLAARGDRAWRRLEPGLWDYELAYADAIDALDPDLIHAHDFRMLGVGARATVRARARGRSTKLVWDAHEYVPGLQPWRDNRRWLPAHMAYEKEYAPYADAAVTVSAELADLLVARHHLAERPAIVLNAPEVGDRSGGDGPVPDLRALCGVAADDPLLVYSGVMAPKRGVGIMVEALPRLPDVHVALVVPDVDATYVRQLVARASDFGAAGRIHVLPYVAYWQVSTFLAAADAGVIPIHHYPNHEIALITKFFEYAHARLPIVVSDVRAMSETVTRTGQGEVFVAEDIDDYVRAVRAVLADPDRYRKAYEAPGLLDSWTWPAQARVLDEVYTSLHPGPQ